MSSVIHQPHDRFFKLSLGEPLVAQEFFMEHLPVTVLEKINLTVLMLENHSFIDENYKGTEADIVYSTQVDGTKAYLYLLCEQQSTVDPLMAFRLWVYMIRLMEMHLKQHPDQPLPLIYPMVVYTGQEPWSAPLDIFSLYGDHADLARDWLLQPFQLLDIHKISDDDMRKRQWCGIVEFALKNNQIKDIKQYLKIVMPWVRELEQSGRPGYFLGKIVLRYLLNGAEAQDINLFVKFVQQYLSPELGGEIMTLAQQFMLRGQQQGEVAVMTRQLKHRFNRIPDSYLSRIEQADAETRLQWCERILDAKSLEEIFE